MAPSPPPFPPRAKAPATFLVTIVSTGSCRQQSSSICWLLQVAVVPTVARCDESTQSCVRLADNGLRAWGSTSLCIKFLEPRAIIISPSSSTLRHHAQAVAWHVAWCKRAVDARATLLLGKGGCKTQNAHEARARPFPGPESGFACSVDTLVVTFFFSVFNSVFMLGFVLNMCTAPHRFKPRMQHMNTCNSLLLHKFFFTLALLLHSLPCIASLCPAPWPTPP